jgi:hypothetical protein
LKSVEAKGRPSYERTEEHRKLQSAAHKGIQPRGTGWKHRAETREKMAQAWTPEKREAARERGERMAQDREWRLRIAQALSGERNPMWQGGIANSQYAPGFSKTLKAQIRARDRFTCQLCGMTEDELGYRLSIHHSDYDKTNHDETNLFATCKRCNSLVNTNREVWLAYFTALAKMRAQLGEDVGQLIDRKIVTQRKGFVSTQHLHGGDVGPDISLLFTDI